MAAEADAQRHVLSVIRHPVGGIRTYLKYTYGGLDPRRWRFTFLTPAAAEARALADDFAGRDARFIEVAGRSLELRLLRAIRRALRSRSYDLVHSQGFTAGVLTALANNWPHIPHVITPHEVFPPGQFPATGPRMKKRLFARVIGRADRIQFVSDDARRNFLDVLGLYWKRPARLVVIRNGIDLSAVPAPGDRVPGEFRREIGAPPDTLLLGFLGRFMPAKGFDILIEAVRSLASEGEQIPPFLVVAVNDGAYIREYKRMIDDLGLGARFAFPGFRPRIGPVLRDLDVVLMPSRWEACGLVAMEALAAGVPVVASDCVGLREVVAGSPAIVVHALDSASLAAGIRRFLLDPAAQSAAARGFAPVARAAADVRKSSQQLEGLFEGLLGPAEALPAAAAERR